SVRAPSLAGSATAGNVIFYPQDFRLPLFLRHFNNLTLFVNKLYAAFDLMKIFTLFITVLNHFCIGLFSQLLLAVISAVSIIIRSKNFLQFALLLNTGIDILLADLCSNVRSIFSGFFIAV